MPATVASATRTIYSSSGRRQSGASDEVLRAKWKMSYPDVLHMDVAFTHIHLVQKFSLAELLLQTASYWLNHIVKRL